MTQAKNNTSKKGGFWGSSVGFVILSVLAVLIVSAVCIAVTLFWLDNYTRHGEEVVVPDIEGTFIEEATVLVSQQGLHVEVIDSTYSRKVPLGTVVDQSPKSGSHAKHGRPVYVIVNARTVRTIPVPDLRDMSYRQAEATLRSIGFGVAEIEYEPSVYKDLVLDVKNGDLSVESGTRLPEGTVLTLVVGFGQGTEQVKIPDLIGKNKSDARASLLASRLILGSVEYDEERTAENDSLFFVFAQSPMAGEEILEGSRIDISMTTSVEKVTSSAMHQSEEEFF
ncbi:MAG: PASTA domain-containing protein [Paludibacteraceae bacterium]|nr:PASTA domain-containing protein [Paludibacteraceae bacterium]